MSSMSWRGCELIGSQVPRVWSAPSATTSAGREALYLAETAGLDPMPWQRFVCEHGLREHADGSWAALSLLLILPRQNGKGSVIEIIELYALFELGQNVYHTAHLMSTCRKAFKRLWSLIKRTPALLRRVAGKPHSTADQVTITLTNGAFISFVARSARMGRGFDDVDLLVLDEALFLDPAVVQAVVSGMTTRPKPLIIYASSAGVVGSSLLRDLRQRMVDRDPTIAGFEWSVDPDVVAKLVKRGEFDPLAVEHLAMSNPSLADRKPPGLVTVDWCRGEFAELGLAGYLRERLGVFDEDPAAAKRVISAAAWLARGGLADTPEGQVAFAVAGSPSDAVEQRTAILSVIRTDEGELVPEVVDYHTGTSWVPARLRELVDRWSPVETVLDPADPVGFLAEDIERAGVDLTAPTPREVAYAAQLFAEAVIGDAPTVRHYDQAALDIAVKAASKAPAGDGAWKWHNRGETDISPVRAASLAAWAVSRAAAAEPLFAWSSS